MKGEFVRLEETQAIRHLVLDAPQRRNALDTAMLDEIAEAVRTVAADREARVLVVSAEGKAFCAGADVRNLFGEPNRPPAEIRADMKPIYGSFLGLLDLDIPTIAAVGGAAVGAGVNIALACDVVVAGPSARFAITFADIGLHPGGGCSWFLTRRMGYPRAMATILGAESLDAREAFEAGLVSECADDEKARALELAARYAERDPGLMKDMKRAVRIAADSGFATTLEFESWAQASSVTQPRFQEYMATFGR
ncbi:enoyl-CoA hydratase [Streptomyces hygroscopicus]|uniref:enoyl-CoA hydratase n=1 Tax=Streptomyces hygroscopicus TaxID=1912 RepID=UPI0036427E96